MAPNQEKLPSGRVVSIDALRGFDMFWIIGGDVFFRSLLALNDGPISRALVGQLEHSRWDGFTFYDLIFPLFLFIVGVSMPFSIGKRLERGDSRRDLYLHVLKRAVVLFALGLVYNHILDLDFSNFRWAGVLQRIALSYLFAAVIFMNTGLRGRIVSTASILVFYWLVMILVPVPGIGSGVLTPEGNLASYIDRLLLPGRFCCFEFGDNEGILSTLPAVATTLLGCLAGSWLKASAPPERKIRGLLFGGVAGLTLGLLWGVLFPVNKLIWSSSYVLYAAGWSALLLGAFYWLIDVRGYRKWAFPFVVIGLNPILIYVLHSVFDFGVIVDIFVRGFVDSLGVYRPAFWAFSILAVEWLFLYFLFKKKVFLKA